MKLIIQTFILVIGFVLLIKGADWFVEGASKIADKFKIPQIVIGLTIVAFGTSAPEAAVSISAALKGKANPTLSEVADITIGNVFGSNILNILIILGITAIIIPLVIENSTLYLELPFVIFISVVVLFLGMQGNQISTVDGIILWALFIVFFIYLIYLSKKKKTSYEEIESGQNESMIKLLVITAIGMAAIIYGSDLTVDSASNIAKALGLSDRFIGLTVVALGTSLPELITSITAGMKGKNDIAIGNIIGSNIFNILFVIGTTALITPVPFAAKFTIDGIVCIAAAILLLLCVIRKKKLTKTGGIVMLLGYALYFVYLISQ